MTDWEEHYRSGDLPWDKGAASPALLEALERVALGGRVLVPGCGLGHDARALAGGATEVVGVDVAPSAVAAARARPPLPNVRFAEADLFDLPPELRGNFDGVWEHTCFCAIDPARRAAYVEAIAGALRPGGQLLGVFYLDPGQELAADGPPFEVTLAELDRLFAPRFRLASEWMPMRTYPGREGREWVRHFHLI